MNIVYTISHYSTKIPPELAGAKELLESNGFKVIFRWSKNHVPHLVIDYKKGFSICWFQSQSKYKLFYPYPGGEKQQRENFTTISDIITRLKEEE